MSPTYLIGLVLLYLVATRSWLALVSGRPKAIGFALINLIGAYFLFWTPDVRAPWYSMPQDGQAFTFPSLGNGRVYSFCFAAYLAVVSVQYLLMRKYSSGAGRTAWMALLAPIAFLAGVKFLPTETLPVLSRALEVKSDLNPDLSMATCFVGASYLAFRCSHLAMEVRNGTVERPTFAEYLGFSFFLPTLAIGPISPYRLFAKSLHPGKVGKAPLFPPMYRIAVGGAKYLFLANLANQLSYKALLLDGHRHAAIDLVVSAIAYYLYIYCNFSGFCDIAIGAAGLLGIEIHENFHEPLSARNIRDFWNRWHITLSLYMRDMVFAPLSKSLVRWAGPQNVNHCVAVSVIAVFLLIGIWHGIALNYFCFGAMHAIGIVLHHYYSLALKQALGRERFRAYNQSFWIRSAATALTFCFVTASFFLFANSTREMREIILAIRWR